MENSKRVKIRSILFGFLRKHGCLREYITNIKNEYGENYKDGLNSLIDRGDYTRLITFPFTWSFTEEGEEYWTEVHKEWCDYVFKNLIEELNND